MKSDQKCNCNVSNACLCLYRSAISSHSALRSSTEPQKMLMLNVQLSNLSIDGFRGDVIRLQSQKSVVLRILIHTRLKIKISLPLSVF